MRFRAPPAPPAPPAEARVRARACVLILAALAISSLAATTTAHAQCPATPSAPPAPRLLTPTASATSDVVVIPSDGGLLMTFPTGPTGPSEKAPRFQLVPSAGANTPRPPVVPLTATELAPGLYRLGPANADRLAPGRYALAALGRRQPVLIELSSGQPWPAPHRVEVTSKRAAPTSGDAPVVRAVHYQRSRDWLWLAVEIAAPTDAHMSPRALIAEWPAPAHPSAHAPAQTAFALPTPLADSSKTAAHHATPDPRHWKITLAGRCWQSPTTATGPNVGETTTFRSVDAHGQVSPSSSPIKVTRGK